MRKKKRAWVMGGLLCASAAIEARELAVSLTCPTTVEVNQRLTVRVTLSNSDCDNPVPVTDMMAGIAGNGAGALALIGPFKKTFTTPIFVPQAFCKRGSVVRPGRASKNVIVTNKAPADFAGTMVLVFVEGLDGKGAGKFGNQCFTEVVP
jgi:hypothetical protein